MWDAQRRFGFVRPEEGGDVYIPGDEVADGGSLHPGDIIEFEIETGGEKPVVRGLKVVTPVPEGTPVGLVSGSPPTWDELEDSDREERQRRRGRRR